MTTVERTTILESYRDLTNSGASKEDALEYIAGAFTLQTDMVREVVGLLYESTQENC